MSDLNLDGLARRRDLIDEIDLRLLDLLNERTAIVEEIGQIKQQLHLAVYEPKREEEVFRNLFRHNRGPLSPDAVKRIFERIIDEMRTLQRMKLNHPDESPQEGTKDKTC